MAHEPGWHHDPFGRYQQRYHDGERWTEHVATGGEQQVDPLGDSPAIPFVTPPTAFDGPPAPPVDAGGSGDTPPPAATSGDGSLWTFLDGMGPDARERPAPRLHAALAGAAGAVAAIGLTALIVGDGGGRGEIGLTAAIVIAAAYGARAWRGANAEVRAAAVGAVVVGIALVSAAVFEGDDFVDSGPYFLLMLLYLVAWVVPVMRGRPLLLGLGMLSAVTAVGVTRVTGADLGSPRDLAADLAIVFLLGAAALFGLVWLLDRRGYPGVATPIVVAALICAQVGLVASAVRLDEEGSALVLTAVGFLVCAVGHLGMRRATTWYGAWLTASGVVSFLAAVVEPSSGTGVGLTMLVAAAILLATPMLLNALERSRTGQQPPAAFAPPST